MSTIYNFGEALKEPRFSICVKCKKVQKFDAPGDWRPECCKDSASATAVDLFNKLGKIPKVDPLPTGFKELQKSMLELLFLITDVADKEAKENSENPA